MFDGTSASSIKTRIKTGRSCYGLCTIKLYECIIH